MVVVVLNVGHEHQDLSIGTLASGLNAIGKFSHQFRLSRDGIDRDNGTLVTETTQKRW